ncbi:unnamed protein product [Symbiodinium natans]|uniref:Helitron helicase-like domain-containing protein n=1 Tax=Symbiodinium natans TaxID=878477 RepID=A0A812IB31_9DINO|nr:unnamed protein product [Symbiodinium natans]
MHMDRSDEVAFLREEVSRLRHQVAILQGDLSGAHLTTDGLLTRVLALEQSSSGHTVRLSDMEADLELCNTRLAEVQESFLHLHLFHSSACFYFETCALWNVPVFICRTLSASLCLVVRYVRSGILYMTIHPCAEALRETNPVYRSGVAEINRQLLAEWFGSEESLVPPPVLDCVVAVPVGDAGPGTVRQTGPADATEAGEQARQETSISQDLSETCVLAMEPQVEDFNSHGREVSMMLVGMLQKLEELEHAGARSVGLEMESMVDEQRTLVDHLGRKNILELCRQIHESCRQLSAAEQQRRLEQELRDAVMGKSRWLRAPEDNGQASRLLVARGKRPLSLWDWKIWTMAKPRLWRYGDAGNLFERDTNLSTSEWAACLLLREELDYAVDGEQGDSQEAGRHGMGSGRVWNRFSGDWTALHMMATVARLTDQRAAAYNFLKNGGMAFAKKLEKLSAEDLANAAHVAPEAGGVEQFFKEAAVPQTVKDALHAMNSASATVVGTDGHRRQCRHEGVAHRESFGPPLLFLTPNPADTQRPLQNYFGGYSAWMSAVQVQMISPHGRKAALHRRHSLYLPTRIGKEIKGLLRRRTRRLASPLNLTKIGSYSGSAAACGRA